MTHQLRPQSRYSLRTIWTEAELLIFGNLRLGLHPRQLERVLDKNLQLLHDDDDDYRVLFRSTCQRIINSLEGNGLFKKLPSVEVYDELVGVPVRRAKFEVMMYHRFEDGEMFKKNAMDDEMEPDMGEQLPSVRACLNLTENFASAEDEPLDSASLEVVEAMHKTVRKEVEANYTANRKILQGIPEKFLVEMNMENPFVYGTSQKQWEGQGNRPEQYSLPARPYQRPRKYSLQVNKAVTEKNPEALSLFSTPIIANNSTANLMSDGHKLSGSNKTPAEPQAVLPHTPKNNSENPIFHREHLGGAYFARPISLGSPEKPQHPRPGCSVAVKIKCAKVEPHGICLDTYFDVVEDTPKQTLIKKSDSAEDFGCTEGERACQTLEECMEWADDIVRKYSVPESIEVDKL
ncbi:hypothetical protein BKA65DRAFT_554816 [Rhexocercosporidium sp. MPI-PUGE-AT-0058]|nr:hypothetical protein BKA65DRAFT_554816 [Rhexocercosporidium sp. MPI-PUGE-AT-0058]